MSSFLEDLAKIFLRGAVERINRGPSISLEITFRKLMARLESAALNRAIMPY